MSISSTTTGARQHPAGPSSHDPSGQSGGTTALRRKSPAFVIFLCFVSIVFDGYDLVVYGTIVPALLNYEAWGLTPVETGAYGSYALAGMFIGAILVGYLTDIVGRRKILLYSVAAFSILMLATALAPSPLWFGVFRFLAGLGLGGVIPTAIAVTVEFSRPERRNFNNAAMFSGYAVGGILAALLAMLLLDLIGFRGMLAIGALPIVTVLPRIYFFMPESPAFLRARGRTEEADHISNTYGLQIPARTAGEADATAEKQKSPIATMLGGRLLAATILFCLAGIAGQTLVYGLNTWMPQLLIMADYSMTSSLSFLLTTNIGAVVGVLVSSNLADRFGPRVMTAISFIASGTALVLMGTGVFPMWAMYLLVAIVGFGSIGAQILVNGFVATFFSDSVRATALGVTLGVGRLGAVLAIAGGGVLIAASLPTMINFSIWSAAALIGLIAVLLVPRTRN
ncbi:aromatic acid/H+ symport family MFS transporter [Corynebacterium sp. YIM 101645]|uniref:Aromatic acid/H+ symport family MFS transporter n=1 Tax=Corynebacterium lemuris TaxID=1859292 RepID=A0ABT2G1U6_9CORY|nr:aromatic acid/H+ symport family MFS transporter [Corynebacterium lemuris]MCS5480693.1 aromatic acid/H+ symport family MFS transporter [Corynebacterium lemuris]